MNEFPIREFGTVSSLKESTHLGRQVQELTNVLLRPAGGFKGPPILERLWGIATFSSLKTAIHGGTSVFTLKTTAVKFSSQGKNFLIFYDWIHSECRGLFYLGDDGTFTGTLNLFSGTVVYESLATGLDADARWYGQRVYDQIILGNGIDDNLIAQLGRTQPAAPDAELRYAGSNAVPATPIVSAVPIVTIANVQATWVVSGRASGVALTFTADSLQFPGTSGHNIRVGIVYDSYDTGSPDISRSGAGTLASPYAFTIRTRPTGAGSSNNAIVAAVAASTLCFGIMSCTTASSNNAEDVGNWGSTALSGGVDANSSVGFFDTIKSVYLRYWDPGHNGCGYEAPSSAKSADIVIGDSAGNERDIQVKVTGNASVAGGRFTFIRIYLQFGLGDDAIWSLVREVPNTTGTAIYTLGTDVVIGQAMSIDQGRPLPSKFATFAGQKTWLAGIEGYPSRVAISKQAVEDEKVPEGMNQESFIEVPGQLDESGGAEIRALVSDEQYVHVHTTRGITLVTPSDLNRFNAPVQGGAMSQNMIAGWERGRTFYLSLSLMLFDFNGARYGKRDAAFKSLDAAAYMRDRVSESALGEGVDRAWMMPDTMTQLLWFWLPDDNGTLRGYAYDTIMEGITGPYDFPKVYASCTLEPNRPEFICVDEGGNLFVWNPASQADHGDELDVQAAFTPRALSYTPPATQNGWLTVTYGGAKYTQATDCVMETGMLDMGDGSGIKAFRGLTFRSIPNSRALVEITFIGKSGISVTRTYGDVGAYQSSRPHKVTCGIQDTAVKIRFRFICAEQKSAIFRDFCVLWEKLGRA
jgi:hypothetical protein